MRHLTAFLLLVLAVQACDSPKMPLPGITGRAGELVIVMDNKYWNGPAGDTVFNILSQPVYGLPQAEPMFNVVHIARNAFSKIFRTHRNLLLVDINAKNSPSVSIKKDVWASHQLVLELKAPNASSLIGLLQKNGDRLMAQVLEAEKKRTLRSYRAQLNGELVKPIETEQALKLSIPLGYNLISKEDDFLWIRYETKDVMQSILVHTEPYKLQNTFTEKGMLKVLNSMMKQHVPGPDPGSFMHIYAEYPVRFEETSLSGVYAARISGLWKVDRALMGGPFVSYALLDRQRNRVIYLCGFVFAPSKTKRNYVRQVDAIISSLEVIQ